MNGRRFINLAALAALFSAAMFASTVNIALGSNPFPANNAGPYTATINGLSTTIICDDEVHTVYANESWQATVTPLSTLIALGNSGINAGSVVEFKGLPNATTLYEEAAWLAYQFATHPIGTADVLGIQSAIWDLFLQHSGTGSVSDPTSSAYWMAQANTNYGSLTGSQIAGFRILTPVSGSQMPLSDGMPQEFFNTTPEPATYALFGSGLILLSLGTFRRRRNQNK